VGRQVRRFYSRGGNSILMVTSQTNFRDLDAIGREMHRLMEELFPICRSITGAGVCDTLKIIEKHIPLSINNVASGTKVFDWRVPKEWNIYDAYIKNSKGEKIVDFKNSNLHILNYSIPVNKKVLLQELKEHLFSLPEYPDWIPYRTSYYNENWGFCLSHNQLSMLKDEEYEVVIDSSLTDGNLTYGEYLIRGEKEEEMLISCHVCHPSLCNDNLSGISVAVFLAKHLDEVKTRFSYRFLFIPATIGSITWLAENEHHVSKIKHGLIAVNLGDLGNFTYKRSRQGNAEIDQVVINVLKNSGKNYEIIDFIPYGYDERQFCSPGFNLPVGSLMRTPHGEYPEYHTSADNLEFVKPQQLVESLLLYQSVLNVIDNNTKYLNLNPKCEPQLGKRGVYREIGGLNDNGNKQMAILWVLNLSDGQNSLLDIADKSGLPFDLLKEAADALCRCNLLRKQHEKGN
jgi:aminopeptidase-like protein